MNIKCPGIGAKNKVKCMSIIASCGHKLREEEGHGKTFAYRDYDRMGEKIVVYGQFCSECSKTLERPNSPALKTKEEEEKWLRKIGK